MKQLNQTKTFKAPPPWAKWLLSLVVAFLLSPAMHAQCTVQISNFQGETHICDTGIYYYYSVKSDTGHYYNWNIWGGSIISGSNSSAVTVFWSPGSQGALSVYEVEKNQMGCHDSVFIPITKATPVAYIIGDSAVCGSTSGTYYTDSSSFVTKKWSVTGGQIVGSDSDFVVSVNWGSSGPYKISLVSSFGNCSDTASRFISVLNNILPIEITGQSSACVGDSIVLQLSDSISNSSDYQIFWYTTDTTARLSYRSSLTSGVIPAVGINDMHSGQLTIIAKLVYKWKCSVYDTFTVTVNGGTPSISGNTNPLQNNSYTYTFSSALPSSATLSVTGGHVTQSGSTSAVIQWDSAGAGVVMITNPTSSCDTLKVLNVCITPRALIQKSNVNRHYCNSSVATFNSGISSATNYQWSIVGGTITSGGNSSQVAVEFDTAGSGYVQLTATVNGCSVTDTFHFSTSQVSVAFSGPGQVCNSPYSTYTASNWSSNFSWSVTDGTIVNQTNNTIQVSWGITDGTVTLKNNSTTCPDSVTKAVSVYNVDPKFAYKNTTTCLPDSIHFAIGTTDPKVTYKWIVGSDTLGTGQTFNQTFLYNGMYIVTVLAEGASCRNSFTDTVIINDGLDAGYTLSPDSVSCLGILITYLADDTTSGNTYVWSFGDGTSGSGYRTTHQYQSSGWYTVSMVATSPNGCFKNAYQRSIWVMDPPSPTITYRNDTLYSSRQYLTHQWYLDGVAISGATDWLYYPTASGTYTVEVSSGVATCTGISTGVQVTVPNTIYGYITTSTSAVLANQKVYLIQVDMTDTSLYALDTTLTDSGGYYEFETTESSVYVMAWPDSASYSGEMPTYYDSSLTIFGATNFQVQTGSNQVSFSTIAGTNTGGTGFLGGKIFTCTTCKTGSPVADVRVILVDENDRPVAYTYTDENGYFEFDGLELKKYRFWVDRDGISNLNAPQIELTADNAQMKEIEMELFPDHLELISTGGTGFRPDATTTLAIDVFPNPYRHQLFVRYELAEAAPVQVSLQDLSGRSVLTQQYTRLQQGVQTLSVDGAENLEQGVYLLRIQIGERVATQRIIHFE